MVVVGAKPRHDRLLGPLVRAGAAFLWGRIGRRRMTFFITTHRREDLALLKDLLDTGAINSVIDREYGLSAVPEAMRYLGQWHARGKVVITM